MVSVIEQNKETSNLGDAPKRVVEAHSLQTLDDCEEQIVAVVPKIPMPRDVNPWKDETPDLVSRRYQCVSVVLSTQNFSSPIVKIDLPHFINGTPAKAMLSKYASGFRYMRWKYAVFEWQIMSVPQLYGLIAFTGMPIVDSRRGSTVVGDYGLVGHEDTVWCDLAEMNSGRLEIPWLSYNKWLDLRPKTGGPSWASILTNLSQLCSLKIMTNGIYSVSSTIEKSVTIDTFVRLEGVEFAGPINPAEMQSFDAAIDAAWNLGSRYVNSKAASFIEKGSKKAINLIDEALGDHFDFDDGWADGEAGTEKPATENVDDGTMVIQNPFGTLIANKPRNHLGRAAITLPKAFARDNEIFRWLMVPALYAFGNIAYGSDVTFNCWPFYDHRANVKTANCSRLMFARNFYRLWRGGVWFHFLIPGTPFVVSKVSFCLSWDNETSKVGNVVNDIVTVKGFTRHSIYVPYLYALPFMPTTLIAGFDNNVTYRPQLRVTLLSQTKNAGDVNAVVPYICYRSPANDFTFLSQQEPQPYYIAEGESLESEPVEMQCTLRSLGLKVAPANYEVHEAPLLTPPTEETTWEGLARRWTSTQLDYNNLQTLGPLTIKSYYNYHTIDCLRTIFLYRRGSYQIKARFGPSDAKTLMVKMGAAQDSSYIYHPVGIGNTGYRACDGLYSGSADKTEVVHVTVPWICTSDWVESTSNHTYGDLAQQYMLFQPYIYTDNNISPVCEECFIAGGPDFKFSYSFPPPIGPMRWYA